MTTFRLQSRFQHSIPPKYQRVVLLDNRLVERLLEANHLATTRVVLTLFLSPLTLIVEAI